MTTRHTIIDASGEQAKIWYRDLGSFGTYEDFVRSVLATHAVSEAGEEVSSYAADPVDVIFDGRHFVLSVYTERGEEEFTLQEIKP